MKERNLGIDLLRMIAMLAIITYHMLGHGWILPLIHKTSWKFEFLTALHALCMTGVNCFVLISGYVGVHSRGGYSGLAVQWVKVLFYSVVITLAANIWMPGEIGAAQWRAAVTPTISRQYWYFTAYAGCMMVSPLIRTAIKNMKAREAGVCAALLAVVFSLLNTAGGEDPFYTNGGNNTLWLIVLYAIGAYLGWFRPHRRIPAAALWAAAGVSAVLLGGYTFIGTRTGLSIFQGTIRNDSPLTLAASILLLLLFSEMRIVRGRKYILTLSAASFGVYLIHDHPLVRRYIISEYVYPLSNLGTWTIVPGILAAAAGIYLVCAAIDMLRGRLFDALRVQQRIASIGEKLSGGQRGL